MPRSRNITKTQASAAIHRNIRVGRRRTSVRFPDELIDALAEIAEREGQTAKQLFAAIARDKPRGVSLSAALRMFATQYFREACTEEGHRRAGHGKVR
jgi:predicted DNA-binding ribbon-helix-helix protein